jgi:hypothetical protein
MKGGRCFGAFLFSCWIAGCLTVREDACSLDNPCKEGYSCNAEQICIPAEPLRIQNTALPAATALVPYQETLRAAGGIMPYTWSIETPLGWLLVEPETGFLFGVPDLPSAATLVKVAVTDSSFSGGETVTADLPIVVLDCVSEASRACFVAEINLCYAGVQTCRDASWGTCLLTTPSIDIAHCGSACAPCDSLVSDQCLHGVCSCGKSSACTGGERCCLGNCREPKTDLSNCGACGRDCASEVQHASEVRCSNGFCDYGQCDIGFFDCNQNHEDGCEEKMDVSHCGCGVDCGVLVQNAEGIQCVFLSGNLFVCSYDACKPGFMECDESLADGCETAVSAEHCGACWLSCGAEEGGPRCDGANRRCYCAGNEECNNFIGSTQGCNGSGTQAQCGCGDGPICSGGAIQCCPGEIQKNECTDLLADPKNCGRCGVRCGGNTPDCRNGQCGCLGGFPGVACPLGGPAPVCSGQRCVCPDFGGGDGICPDGRTCCDGGAGGNGSPGGDIGCCRDRCGLNQPGDCREE